MAGVIVPVNNGSTLWSLVIRETNGPGVSHISISAQAKVRGKIKVAILPRYPDRPIWHRDKIVSAAWSNFFPIYAHQPITTIRILLQESKSILQNDRIPGPQIAEHPRAGKVLDR